jgi:hypothetical protein
MILFSGRVGDISVMVGQIYDNWMVVILKWISLYWNGWLRRILCNETELEIQIAFYVYGINNKGNNDIKNTELAQELCSKFFPSAIEIEILWI